MTLGKDFTVMDFPHIPRVGCVYVLFWVADFLGEEIPFYVGQTDKISRRMDNYYEKRVSSARDFIVGEAIEYLEKTKNFHIIVKYRRSKARRDDEKKVIRDLWSNGKGVPLLNPEAGGLPRYDESLVPKEKEHKADHDREVKAQRKIVRLFCKKLIKEAAQRRLASENRSSPAPIG